MSKPDPTGDLPECWIVPRSLRIKLRYRAVIALKERRDLKRCYSSMCIDFNLKNSVTRFSSFKIPALVLASVRSIHLPYAIIDAYMTFPSDSSYALQNS